MNLDLTAEVYKKVTYRQVRDVFQKIGFNSFCLASFTCRLFIKEQKSELLANNAPGNYRLDNLILLAIDTLEGRKNYADNFISMRAYLEVAEKVLEVLCEQSLIRRQEERYEIERNGHSLRMQKALKRLPIIRVEKLLREVILSVEIYNSDSDDFIIDALFLFGSVLEQKETVGDIDMAFSFSRRLNIGETSEQWSKRISEKYGIVNEYIFASEQLKKLESRVKGVIRISPYISLMNGLHLNEMIKKSDAVANILWREKGYTNSIGYDLSSLPFYSFISV